MIGKLIVSAVWVCLVTAGSIYGSVTFLSGNDAQSEPDEFFGGLDYVKSPTISVPVVDGGKVAGYVVAQFVYTAEAKILKQLSVPPDLILTDEAFRYIYGEQEPDFDDLEKYDLDGLRTNLVSNINERFGSEIVKDVLVEQFNYVPIDQVRFGPNHGASKPDGEASAE